MTFEELMQRLKAAKNTAECTVVELDAIAAARNGSITPQERDQLIAESRLMRKRLKEVPGRHKRGATILALGLKAAPQPPASGMAHRGA